MLKIAIQNSHKECMRLWETRGKSYSSSRLSDNWWCSASYPM